MFVFPRTFGLNSMLLVAFLGCSPKDTEPGLENKGSKETEVVRPPTFLPVRCEASGDTTNGCGIDYFNYSKYLSEDRRTYYSRALAKLGEPPICAITPVEGKVFRILLCPWQGRSVVVRIEQVGRQVRLITRWMSGATGDILVADRRAARSRHRLTPP